MTARDYGPRWYDQEGNRVTIRDAERLLADVEARRVAYTDVSEEVSVSTVHLVLDHNWSAEGPPLIYETLVFAPEESELDGLSERTSNKHAALAAHDRMVAEVRAGLVVAELERDRP